MTRDSIRPGAVVRLSDGAVSLYVRVLRWRGRPVRLRDGWLRAGDVSRAVVAWTGGVEVTLRTRDPARRWSFVREVRA